MRRLLVILAVGLVLAALAFVSNPSPDRHQDAIKAAVAERSPVAGALGFGALAAVASTYRSWGVASTTTLNDRTITIGALGLVHVRPLLPDPK